MVRSPEEITPQQEATMLGDADALAILDSGVRGAGTHPRHKALAMVEAVSGVNGKRTVHQSRQAAGRYSPQSATPHPC
jgi:hypothetical protein